MGDYDPQVARMVSMSGFAAEPPRLQRRTSITAPVFVVGAPRSGTTVLGKCLAAHPDFAGDEESLFLMHLWELFAQRHQGLFRQGWAPLAGYISTEDLLIEMGKFADTIWASLIARSSGSRVVDHTPVYGLIAPFINALYPDATYVHLIRDGRSVVASLHNSAAQGFSWADAEVRTLASMWRDIVETTRERCSGLGEGRYMEVRYEELCSAPEKTLRDLSQRLGVSWADTVLAPLATPHARPARDGFTLGSIHSGKFTERAQPSVGPVDASWPPEAISQFNDVAGRLLGDLGY